MAIYVKFLILSAVSATIAASARNNQNCPAPRAPDNGLSFIFRNGELVHFRCHPGYNMQGKAIAYCVNNVWTQASPLCIPINAGTRFYDQNVYGNLISHNRHRVHHQDHEKRAERRRELFNWGDQASNRNVYGDGPRRLPLINGIWPPQNVAEQVLAFGPQSTPGPKTMVKEEIDIAELRNKQLEEVKKQRFDAQAAKGKRRQGKKKNKRKVIKAMTESDPRETILSLGSTEDGQALSVALAKPSNGTTKHKHRHNRGERKWQHQEKKNKLNPSGVGRFLFISSRQSRVNNDDGSRNRYHIVNNDVVELRRRPVEQVQPNRPRLSTYADYTANCVDMMYGREVPKLAPQVANGFVYRYDTKRNKNYPFNKYSQVKYRCLRGFEFATNARALYCKNSTWVGEIPRCTSDVEITRF